MIARKRRYLPSIDYFNNSSAIDGKNPSFHNHNSPLPSEYSLQGTSGALGFSHIRGEDNISGGASLFQESLKKRNLNASFVNEGNLSQERQ
jgi:hypothetical protein